MLVYTDFPGCSVPLGGQGEQSISVTGVRVGLGFCYWLIFGNFFLLESTFYGAGGINGIGDSVNFGNLWVGRTKAGAFHGRAGDF